MGKKVVRKLPITKLIWQWTENVSPDNVGEEELLTAYRLRLGKCKACRKNCPGNPACLRGIGESSWLKQSNYQDDVESEIEDLNNNIRKEGEFVGLKNLGATCYVNTFLQLWFHNLNFRKAVYSYQEIAKENEPFPNSVCGHLQLMFGLLQCSNRKNIDPSSFIKCLGLDTDLQQDAQEFSKLLLNLLDQSSEVGAFLCKEFCGEYEYCTTCKSCGTTSKKLSKFYELDLSIQGNNDIKDCLREFLKEEILEKENQYNCENCQCSRDASRQIVIKTLPETLNLQLLRFVFDKSSWTKKKLSSVLSFPDVLDLSAFVLPSDKSDQGVVYELTAVLIHRGPSAFSGHYIAHIKDTSTGLWHKFNDESVVQLKSGRRLDLDSLTNDDYEIDMPTPPKKLKLKKNSHSSKDAYMLVYTKKHLDHSISISHACPLSELPTSVKEAVEKDNNDFAMTMDLMVSDARKESEIKSSKHFRIGSALKEMYDMEFSDLLKDCQWVPTLWLKHILSGIDVEKKEILWQKFLCCHKKLDPTKANAMKCISNKLVKVLIETNAATEILQIKNDMLCMDCVKQQCRILRSKASLAKDHEIVSKILKEADKVENGFYVGRSTLRFWKSMAIGRLKVDDEMNTNKEMNADSGKPTEDSEDEDLEFNEDLFCEHGNVTADAKLYRIIPENAWLIIAKYFPGIIPQPTSTVSGTCSVCLNDNLNAKNEVSLKKMIVTEQKAKLCDLFHNRKRPTHEDLFDPKPDTLNMPAFYGVSSEFIANWQRFIQNSSKFDIVSSVNNSSLVCPHGKLQCDPITALQDLEGVGNDLSMSLLWPSEWDYVSKNFLVDVPICIKKKISGITLPVPETDASELNLKNFTSTPLSENSSTENLSHNCLHESLLENKLNFDQNPLQVTAKIKSYSQGQVSLELCPEICEECLIGRKLQKEHNLRNFKDKEIYVKKVIPDDKSSLMKALNSDSTNAIGARKSTRVHSRGEKAVTVSSDWTLKQLKIKIMQLYSVPPFDQNIWLNGTVLVDDTATLGKLSILPGSTVIVTADEPDEKSLEMLPVHTEKSSIIEEGFKGTGLLGA